MRIRNTRRLLTVAAAIISVYLLATGVVTIRCTLDPKSSEGNAPEVPQLHVVKRCGDDGTGDLAKRPRKGLARDSPETTLHVTSRRPTTHPLAAPFTCSVAWVGEVVHGDVNHPSLETCPQRRALGRQRNDC